MKKPNQMTGGRLSAAIEAEYHALRALIKARPDVYDVIELAKDDSGRWLYLIQCPLEWVFPKFVIGDTDTKNETPVPLVRCSARWAAEDEWVKLTTGKERA